MTQSIPIEHPEDIVLASVPGEPREMVPSIFCIRPLDFVVFDDVPSEEHLIQFEVNVCTFYGSMTVSTEWQCADFLRLRNGLSQVSTASTTQNERRVSGIKDIVAIFSGTLRLHIYQQLECYFLRAQLSPPHSNNYEGFAVHKLGAYFALDVTFVLDVDKVSQPASAIEAALALHSRHLSEGE